MNLETLRKLVSLGEGSKVEFKRKAADPVKIMREVVAFANASGGVLLIGVNDDGVITGLKDADGEAFVLKNAIEKHCKPAINYTLEYIKLNEKKNVLAFHIEESNEKPVFLIYNFNRHLGRAYLRVADRSIQSSRELRKILKARTKEREAFFVYGEYERKLIQFATLEGKIKLKDFAVYANIQEEQASEILVQLTLANVLEIHPEEQGDLYSVKEFNNSLKR
ncbi:MAG: ATP-binding protein [Bacteroidota bacterium]